MSFSPKELIRAAELEELIEKKISKTKFAQRHTYEASRIAFDCRVRANVLRRLAREAIDAAPTD